MAVFPLVVEGDAILKSIFPSKQRAAQQAIDFARTDERVKRIIVFGSAVTNKCGMTSDIDLAIDAPDVSDEEFPSVAHNFFLVDSEVDVVHYNRIHSALLKREIDSKGVVIYVRCG